MGKTGAIHRQLLLGTALVVLPVCPVLAEQTVSQGTGFAITLSDAPLAPEPAAQTLPDWFGTGILDLTIGKRYSPDETYDLGRAAFFVQGMTEQGLRVTASADTGMGPIRNMVDRLDDADPNVILGRMRKEGNTTYSTYGDDSAIVDATPTDGRVYLRVEGDQGDATWGNFTTPSGPTHLNTGGRYLYGAQATLRSEQKTTSDDDRWTVSVHAATPETAAMRDVLDGTGGSVFFLSRQNIATGTQRVVLQTVDPLSGTVLNSVTLSEGSDYRFDALQGVLTLARPVSSYASTNDIVQNGTKARHKLVVEYEYAPILGTDTGAVTGGRADVWLSDAVRLGVQAERDTSMPTTRDVTSVDVYAKLGANSHLATEIAQTKGTGAAVATSQDGGLSITSQAGLTRKSAKAARKSAKAARIDLKVDARDFGSERDAQVFVLAERRNAGFQTSSTVTDADQTHFKVGGDMAVTDRLRLGAVAERFDSDNGTKRHTDTVNLTYDANEFWTVEGQYKRLNQTLPTDPNASGSRDTVGLRVTRHVSADTDIWAFGQTDVARSAGLAQTSRAGAGLRTKIGAHTSLSAEVSDGTDGMGADARVSYAPVDGTEYYIGYTLDPTRSSLGGDKGATVVGLRQDVTDRLSVFSETKWDRPTNKSAVTSTIGATYQATKALGLSGSIERGELDDSSAGKTERTAVSFGGTYSQSDAMSVAGRVEYRTDDAQGTTNDVTAWAVNGSLSYKTTPDWRVLASLDGVLVTDDNDSLKRGEYMRASLGYAYRPVAHDRYNVFLSYDYLHDVPGPNQVNQSGTLDGPGQKSHVFSVDGDYQVSPVLRLGAKLGHRQSEVIQRGTAHVDVSSTATLAVLRADWNFVKEWDILVEGRVMYGHETQRRETGAMTAVYRHINENVKMGIGHEWGAITDDVTDLQPEPKDVFLNIVTTF